MVSLQVPELNQKKQESCGDGDEDDDDGDDGDAGWITWRRQ